MVVHELIWLGSLIKQEVGVTEITQVNAEGEKLAKCENLASESMEDDLGMEELELSQ